MFTAIMEPVNVLNAIVVRNPAECECWSPKKGDKEMICPYCEQGEVVNARIRKNGKEIFVCQECDTVWYQVVNLTTGIGFDLAMSNEGCNNSWDELEFSTNINI